MVGNECRKRPLFKILLWQPRSLIDLLGPASEESQRVALAGKGGQETRY